MKKIDFKFQSEEDAILKAQKDIRDIFNNKSYLNSEKFSNFLD